MTTFRQLLDQFEELAKTRAAKDRRFEEFCESYFRTDPFWVDRSRQCGCERTGPAGASTPTTALTLSPKSGTGKLWTI
jgi:hypothetical protein